MSAKGRKKSYDALFMALQMVLGVIVGVLIGAGWLAFKPVRILDAPPAKAESGEDRHEVIYVRGRPPGRGAQSARKQKAFLDRIPGEIVFAEQDINRWLAGVYGSKEPALQVEQIDLSIEPRVPSVRLVDDEMEIGLEVGVDRAGKSRAIVAQARGRFAVVGGKPVFVPDRIYLGSCPLPWSLGGGLLYERLMSLYPVSDHVTGAWTAVESAEIAQGRLKLVIAGATPVASRAVATEGSVPPAVAPEIVQPSAAVPTPMEQPSATETPATPVATTPVPVSTSPEPAATTPEPAAALALPPVQEATAVLDGAAERVDEANAIIDEASAAAGEPPAGDSSAP